VGLDERGWGAPVDKSRNVSLTCEPGLTCWVLRNRLNIILGRRGTKKGWIPQDYSQVIVHSEHNAQRMTDILSRNMGPTQFLVRNGREKVHVSILQVPRDLVVD
jgi:hypothetical protein